MEIYVFDVTGTRANQCLGMIDMFKSFNFTKKFQGCGTWQLKGNYTEATSDLLKVGRLLYVNPQVCGIIHTMDWSMDDDGSVTYTAYGKELKSILSYRIAWNIYDHNLPTAQWVEGLVRENTSGDRALFSSVKTSGIKCPSYDKQVSYKSLLDCVNDACGAQLTSDGLALGYDVTCDLSSGFDFSLLEGADRSYGSTDPYLVSRYVDNVTTLDYGDTNQDLVNTVLVGGEGEGTARVMYSTTTDGKTYRNLDRREAFADARNVQSKYKDASGNDVTMSADAYKRLLIQEAEEKLVPASISLDAETIITPTQGLELLGAKVTVLDTQLGLKTDDFVTAVDVIEQSDGNLTTLTVGKNVNAQLIIL